VDAIRRQPAHLYGWETNSRTRPRMIARIREVVLERSAVIHSRRLYKQLATFGESDSGRMEGLSGHDDLLFAWGIGLMSRSENYTPPFDTDVTVRPDFASLGLRVKHYESARTASSASSRHSAPTGPRASWKSEG